MITLDQCPIGVPAPAILHDRPAQRLTQLGWDHIDAVVDEYERAPHYVASYLRAMLKPLETVDLSMDAVSYGELQAAAAFAPGLTFLASVMVATNLGKADCLATGLREWLRKHPDAISEANRRGEAALDDAHQAENDWHESQRGAWHV